MMDGAIAVGGNKHGIRYFIIDVHGFTGTITCKVLT